MNSPDTQTQSLMDMSSKSGQDGKLPTYEGRLESRLNTKDLEALQEAFVMTGSHDVVDRLSLSKLQFCEALLLILNKGTKDEYSELFDKIDVTREGYVDWDKFASHMLLEFYEQDDRMKSTQVPQWKDIRMMASPHKELIQSVSYLKNTSRYIAISREGCVSLWGNNLRLQRSLKIGTDSCRARDLWVTNFIPLQNINKIALSFTSKEIVFYDLSTKLEFNCQYKVQGLEFTPLNLDYWSNPNNANEAVIVWGDTGGCVNALFFNSANIALFERPPAPSSSEKQEPCLNVRLQDVADGIYKNTTYSRYKAHSEWVRQVKYSHYLECFISCATTYTNSVVLGWMEKHASVNQNSKQGKTSNKKEIIRQTSFQISQGVNDFDFHDYLNLIATAGVNHHVCLWNPYVVSKPNGVLRGHMASVVQVQFNSSRGQLISFSKDKVLRIWDVQLQVCIQRLAGMFPKGAEVYSTLYFDEGRNRLFISFNYQLTYMEMKVEIRDRIMSHEKPVVTALYNSNYNQVISVCQAGTMIMWLIDSGQKVKQFHNIHGSNEITCLTQDSNQTRLFTGSTDGTVKIWDFNGHCYHTLECAGGQPADIGQVIVLKRSVLAVGYSKCITVFRNSSFKDYHVQASDWKGGQEHTEDILTADFSGPNILATGSYDGEIVIWNTNSEQTCRHISDRTGKKFLKRGKSMFVTQEPPNTHREVEKSDSQTSIKSQPESRPRSRPKSRALSHVSEGSNDEQNEFGWAISKIFFLEARKHLSASRAANLMTCGGNGWVRFWNTAHSTLLAEFVAHSQAGSIIMNVDRTNQYLVTGDVDGSIKVWEIGEYAIHGNSELITTPPPMKCQFQAHQDMINTLEVFERNERQLILSASSDFSVALWDIYGNHIGIFGQEEHWKIEPYIPKEEDEEEDTELAECEEEEEYIEAEEESCWEPDDRAITEPLNYRLNTWKSTILGKDYQELRVRKRERKQPQTIPDLPYLHWERTGQPPAGPYSALTTSELGHEDSVEKPDTERYFLQRPGSSEHSMSKLPNLAETLKTAFDEKMLFPKYIIEYECKMKAYHQVSLQQGQGMKPRNPLMRNTMSSLTASNRLTPSLISSMQRSLPSVASARRAGRHVKLQPLSVIND